MKREIRFQGKKLEYTLIQAPRRDVLIQALEGNLTRVYAPKRMPLSEIDALVGRRAGEILSMQRALAPAPLRSGECVRVEGRPRRLRLEKGTRESFLTETEWVLFCPDPENARQVRDRARSFLAEMALVRIRERLEVYAPRIGVSYGRVTVRNQRTRWGSCSAKGNLNFNWRLILAPEKCLEYVVIHELCHRREFNHSARFWDLVQRQMRDYQVWKDYLKKNGAGLNF
ncbi:MAG: SprT family zinc-dependent metalloprotease [Eubacteriales bacterium]|nr:SprT family zinc-dependent metalloprotease [Eubacteriales bacterium]